MFGGGGVGCVPWDIEIDPTCCPEWTTLSEQVRADALEIATDTLWALSGRRFGFCEATIRPCKAFCLCCGPKWQIPGAWGVWGGAAALWGAGGFYPYVNDEGQWVNCGCGCEGSCCTAACAVYLDPAPAANILAVTVDGVVQPFDSYQVLDGRILVRSKAAGCWPTCNNLALPITQPGTWGIQYLWGLKPPKAALRHAASLACEIAKGCSGMKCRLPRNVTQLSRDGVSITLDPKEFIDAGLTGLPEVDAWLRQVNPSGLHEPGWVVSPDTMPPYQVTWPSGVH